MSLTSYIKLAQYIVEKKLWIKEIANKQLLLSVKYYVLSGHIDLW